MKRAERWYHARKVVVVDGVRTPFAKVETALAEVPAVELARVAIRELLERTEIDPASIDEVIVGNAAPPSDAPNIARVAALEAGIPADVPAYSVQRNCASGFQSITDGYNEIVTGQADVVVAGGVESMSNVPLLFPDEFADVMSDMTRARSATGKAAAATQLRPAHFKPVVALAGGPDRPGLRPQHGRDRRGAGARVPSLAPRAGRVRAPLPPARGRAPGRRAGSPTR